MAPAEPAHGSFRPVLSAADVPDPAVAVSDLVVRYGGRAVLDGLSLEVRAGEILVIMGGSGSGKSTLLRHMLGLERPASGTVRLLGRDLATISERDLDRLRRRIGVAFQSGALLSSLTVVENVMLPLREHTRLAESTMRIMARMKLAMVELPDAEDLMPAELSGGMLKRAALARSIVTDPDLLFCDEPSAGLDPVVSASIDRLILKLREALGMTIVVVTHELESAFTVADRICILDRGKVLVLGTVDEVRASALPRVRDLLGRRPEPPRSDVDTYLQRLTEGV